MGQISRTTNPTRLKHLDRKHFVVRVHETGGREKTFWVEKFDHTASGLSESVRMACIAHAGSTELYIPMGGAVSFDRRPFDISELATDRPLRFRFVFHEPGESVLVGYADGIKAAQDSGQLGGSLVDIEPVDLNGCAWKLELPSGLQESGARPNVLVERSLFPTAKAAVNSPWFGVLVMPEVMRQVAFAISEKPDSLDDQETWPSAWAEFLDGLGVERIAADAEDDLQARTDWVERVVERFCAKGIVHYNMERAMAELDGETK